MSKLRVLHCLETIGSGGVEQRRLSLAQYLDSNRFEQQIICTKGLAQLENQFLERGCQLHKVGVFHGILDPRPYLRTLKIVRKFKPHIIHGAVFEGVALAAICGTLARVPIIITEETSDPKNRSWRGALLLCLLTRLADRVVAISPAVQQYLLQKLKLPSAKVTLINNGVGERPPVDPMHLELTRQTLKLSEDYFVIGSVGRMLDDHKRVSDLIKAMPDVLRACPGARLLLVGGGADSDMLRALASELGLAEHIVFTGYQADTRPYYALMDVFALASVREGFGLVLVEAMLSALPVVATSVGGIPDIVEHGTTGYLVPPMEPLTLADTIVRLYNDPQLRREMGLRGQVRARSQFSARRYVDDVERLYEELASHLIPDHAN